MATQTMLVMMELNEFTADRVRKLALDIAANLIETTPVDTGWARSNWVPSVGSPYDNPVGTREGLDRGPQQSGMAEIGSYQVSLGPVFISNNVPYIQILNDGHSQQAPAGFVQMAIDRAVAEL